MNLPTLVLVHGGLHGAWCWDPLLGELEHRGLPSVTLDLPIEDPEFGSDAYVDVIVQAADGIGPVILVGHSMGGLLVPVAAERLDVRHMVFVCAMLPVPGKSLADQYTAEPTIIGEAQPAFSFDEHARLVLSPDDAKRILYHDCPDELAKWAADRIAPQASRFLSEPCPLAAWPSVPSSYIMCTEDRAVPLDWVRTVVPARLGVEPIALPGGHSPFLSRPSDLATVIGDIVAAYG